MKTFKFLNLTVLIENSQGYSGQKFQISPAIHPVEFHYKNPNSVNQVLSISPWAGLPKMRNILASQKDPQETSIQ